MIKAAEYHATEDEHRRGGVKIRNDAEVLIYSSEQTIRDPAAASPKPTAR
jgi:molecular chaperone DnaK (HSP70)